MFTDNEKKKEFGRKDLKHLFVLLVKIYWKGKKFVGERRTNKNWVFAKNEMKAVRYARRAKHHFIWKNHSCWHQL